MIFMQNADKEGVKRYGAVLECVQEERMDSVIPFPHRDFEQRKSECPQFL